MVKTTTSNLFLRTMSTLVMLPIVLATLFLGDPAYPIFVAAVGSIMAWEWEKMITGKVSSIAVIIASVTTMISFLGADYPEISLVLIAATALLVYIKSGKKLLLSFGVFYICIPVMSLIYLAYINSAYSNEIILWLLFAVWATDVGGYVFGKSIGGPKLAPRFSPKKTWAGLLGGIFFACLITYVFVITMNHYKGMDFPMAIFVSGAAVLAIISQMGDIFESAIKRYLGLKDSSNLIPGHGGIFDRVDGLLFAAPALAVYILLTNVEWTL